MHFVVAAAPSRTLEDYAAYLGGRSYVKVVFGETYGAIRHARAAVINSGTASLEAALIGTPQVVGWSTSPFSAWVARKVQHVQDHIKFISLGNLCLDRGAFRELIQEDFTPEGVADELRRLVEDVPYRERKLADYAAIRESLGGSGASRRVARAMIEELNQR